MDFWLIIILSVIGGLFILLFFVLIFFIFLRFRRNSIENTPLIINTPEVSRNNNVEIKRNNIEIRRDLLFAELKYLIKDLTRKYNKYIKQKNQIVDLYIYKNYVVKKLMEMRPKSNITKEQYMNFLNSLEFVYNINEVIPNF